MVLRFLLGLAAGCLLLGAVLLSSAPALPPTLAPTARDVSAARALALKGFWALRQDRAVPLAVDRTELAAAPRLLAHGTSGLRAEGRIGKSDIQLRASKQLAAQTWLNVTARVGESAPGTAPDISLRVGSLSLPPWLSRGLMDLVIDQIWDEPEQPPTAASLLMEMSIREDAALARVNVPTALLSAFRGLAGGGDGTAARAARATYASLMNSARPLAAEPTLEAIYARAFAGGNVTAGDAKGRTLGVVMAIWKVSAIRWVDGSVVTIPRDRLTPIPATLAGRRDLALHFSISAALAANGEARLTSAIGEWKELDDSLPGGSGFSFVDLAADRAGTRLGQALADPARTSRMQKRLSEAKPGDLLPLAALGFAEGLGEAAFEARYGRLESSEYQAAVARIDAALDRLPLYAP